MQSTLSPSVALSAYADAALSQAMSSMHPGWVVLRHAMVDLNGAWPPAQLQYALLHPQVGIALVDVAPGTALRDGAERLRRRLDAAGFHMEFRRNPPIRQLYVPMRAIHGIGRLLEQEFGHQSPSTLPHGEEWVAAAQRILRAEPSHHPSGTDVDDRPSHRQVDVSRHPAAGRRPVWPLGSARWLGMFWGLVALTVGSGGLVLQHLGPPDSRAGLVGGVDTAPAPSAGPLPKALPLLKKTRVAEGFAPPLPARPSDPPADAQGRIGTDPQRTVDGNDQVILSLQRRLTSSKLEAGGIGAASQAPLDRTLPNPAGAPAGLVKDLPASLTPPAEETTPSASAMPVAQPVQSQPDLPPPAHPDAQASSRVAEVMALPKEFSIPAQATAKSTDATVAVASMLSVPSAGEQAPASMQSLLSPQAPDPTVLKTEKVSAAQSVGSAGTAPFRTPEAAPPSFQPTSLLAEIMIRRADMLLRLGDVSGARLLYERAAAAGSSSAAVRMGQTFDAAFLAGIGITGMGADPAVAASWYRRAAGLGNADASTRRQAPAPISTIGSASQIR